MIDYRLLIDKAFEAQKCSYAPYSSFKVGSALLTKSGKVFSGCNIESSSLGATLCAERVAIAKAISENERDFSAIAIVGSKNDLTPPCGICLQVMSEHCDKDFEIILFDGNNIKIYKLGELLPLGFKL